MKKEDLKNLGLNEEQLSQIEKGFDDYEKEIEKINNEIQEKTLHYEAQIKSIKVENQVNNALLKAGARNVKAVKALMDLESMEFDGENLIGLDENIKMLSQNEETSFLFNKKEEGPNFKGFTAGSSKDNSITKPLNEMTYTELEAYYAGDN